ncbi:TPA_asm: hypothetical protein ES702_05922 [Lokiarchaeia virus SkuldV3]|uniref:Uncharacterized protein n=1 Tax=Lokiarchaeia virus SkuldV3 TaxID=2983915 RepID=A0A9N6YJ50_9VIRU|nr:hypothetical protein QKT74_gp19 [Lokiarchaeia virus SkuldV3]DAZ90959.1 TPA_asm: hypothetical protein ES702_05922 [Lokiarchaeia virus SkuldV3]
MIEIIDKINNTIKKVRNLEIVIHPSSNQILFLKDYQKKGKVIYGIIFDEEGTLFYYKKY